MIFLLKYKISDIIFGEGSCGTIFEATRIKNNKKVAIKRINKNQIKDSKLLSNMRDECSLLHRLNHKNILKVFEWVSDCHEKFKLFNFFMTVTNPFKK